MSRARAAAGTLLFFVLAPGVVAGLVPWLLTRWEAASPLPFWAGLRVVGAVLLAAGVGLLVHAFVRFAVEGLGTPAPVAPTAHLVVGGLLPVGAQPDVPRRHGNDRRSGAPARPHRPFPLCAGREHAFVAFVRAYEEPALARRFGPEYEAYRRDVPGWWPRRPR